MVVTSHDGPTKERIRQGDVAVDQGKRGGLEFRSFAFPLDFYLRRGHLGKDERLSARRWTAGNMLYERWWYGCASSTPYRLMTFGERYSGYRPPVTSNRAKISSDAHEYREAMKAIRSLTARRVAYYVCCEGQKAGAFGNRKRPGMEYLIEALDDLIRHFGV